MKAEMGETERRREKQLAHNKSHNITPKSVTKAVRDIIEAVPGRQIIGSKQQQRQRLLVAEEAAEYESMSATRLGKVIARFEKQMFEHAKNLEFEEAAALRDKIDAIKDRRFGLVEGQTR